MPLKFRTLHPQFYGISVAMYAFLYMSLVIIRYDCFLLISFADLKSFDFFAVLSYSFAQSSGFL
ncbi:uncharacterized protein K441DRAFT_666245 [Cenococcum geophilum 1.58]|uniref:uncharacterized protein n=1 Tax=Cenococcum geophilum 1.58 TaxID=794803 RepID=UPI00359025FF|nr:hypothetical protein K441DRAFT_666245 [Cenococcum geophilum 1.58]